MANGTGGNQQGGNDLQTAADKWPTPMAATPAQNGNSAAGNNDFTRRAEDLAGQMWKTPNVPNGGRTLRPGISPAGMTPDGVKRQVDLENQVRMWETLRGSDGEKGGPNMSFGASGTPLPAQAANWTTPQAHDVTARGIGQVPNSKAGNACLARDAMNLPTATTRDHKGSSANSLTRKDGKSRLDKLDKLDFAAEQGFSRPVLATCPHGLPPSQWRPISRRLLHSVTSHVKPATLRRWLRRGNWKKRRLNPLFVEWLMGWPPGHALCDCSATEFARWQQDMRGALSALPTASAAWIWEPPQTNAKPDQLSLF